MSDQKGLYDKYMVIKVVDGTVIENCFILKPDKDPAAVKALQAYAAATDNKVLAADLYAWVGKPMQKPLTLEQLNECDIFYIEFKDLNEGNFIPVQFSPESHFKGMLTYHRPGWTTHFSIGMFGCGRYWRCWANRPTIEERVAAPWEE
jgi:hypothetical protein